MRPAHEWTEADLKALISDQAGETLTREYKAAAALGKTDGKKAEISKDVSAMANSAGGVIIYGIAEDKKATPRYWLDPFSPAAFPDEWLDQVIDSNISRRVPGLRIKHIEITGTGGGVVAVVSIPQSNLAPHMAKDHIFYTRTELTARPMEEYEVRDVGRRLDSPELSLSLDVKFVDRNMIVEPQLTNSSPVPALYVSVRLLTPTWWQRTDRLEWQNSEMFSLSTPMLGKQTLKSFFFGWSVPRYPAILQGHPYPCEKLVFDRPSNLGVVAWELASPNMSDRRGLLTIRVGDAGVRVDKHPDRIDAIVPDSD